MSANTHNSVTSSPVPVVEITPVAGPSETWEQPPAPDSPEALQGPHDQAAEVGGVALGQSGVVYSKPVVELNSVIHDNQINHESKEKKQGLSPDKLREALAFRQVIRDVKYRKTGWEGLEEERIKSLQNPIEALNSSIKWHSPNQLPVVDPNGWPEAPEQKNKDLARLNSEYEKRFRDMEAIGLGEVLDKYESRNIEAVGQANSDELTAVALKAIKSDPGKKIVFDNIFSDIVSTYTKFNDLKTQSSGESGESMLDAVDLQAHAIDLATQLGTVAGCEFPLDIKILEKVAQRVEYELNSKNALAKTPEYRLTRKGELEETSRLRRIVMSVGGSALQFVGASLYNGVYTLPYVGSLATFWWAPHLVSEQDERRRKEEIQAIEGAAELKNDLRSRFLYGYYGMSDEDKKKTHQNRERELIEEAIKGSKFGFSWS